MSIKITKSVNAKMAAELQAGYIDPAIDFLRRYYPDVNFTNVDYIFSATTSRSRYFRNSFGPEVMTTRSGHEFNANKYPNPVVQICTRGRLVMYHKPSLGMTKHSVWTGAEIQTMCALIHELTHHAQYELGVRQGNELDTTKNELDWLKENSPRHYDYLITTKIDTMPRKKKATPAQEAPGVITVVTTEVERQPGDTVWFKTRAGETLQGEYLKDYLHKKSGATWLVLKVDGKQKYITQKQVRDEPDVDE
jgi:hypothetical protein